MCSGARWIDRRGRGETEARASGGEATEVMAFGARVYDRNTYTTVIARRLRSTERLSRIQSNAMTKMPYVHAFASGCI